MITTQDLGTEEELTLYQDAGRRLYVGDERIWEVSALGDGIVALTTSIRTLHQPEGTRRHGLLEGTARRERPQSAPCWHPRGAIGPSRAPRGGTHRSDRA
jgi:hypothetical protein